MQRFSSIDLSARIINLENIMRIISSVRKAKLDLNGLKNALRHNLRSSAHTKSYNVEIPKEKSAHNRLFKFTRDHKLIPYEKTFNFTEDEIKSIADRMYSNVEQDISSVKDTKGRKRSVRKNMKVFDEFVIFFGTDRDKKSSTGAPGSLTTEETKAINEIDYMDEVLKFIKELERKYGYNDFLIAEHNDEKTKHYQIVASGVNIHTKKLNKMNKAEYSKFGTDLQDMLAEAFKGKTIRGNRKMAKHLSLKEMHANEFKQTKNDNELLQDEILTLKDRQLEIAKFIEIRAKAQTILEFDRINTINLSRDDRNILTDISTSNEFEYHRLNLIKEYKNMLDNIIRNNAPQNKPYVDETIKKRSIKDLDR